ncbi:hypothetical protein XNA1_4030003 [Xenorhabdus nematophila str. Anatoliense]|nr:hypothetical protein XNA1_4030003 [Xenorhabdus nematophila str. Anatoliense]
MTTDQIISDKPWKNGNRRKDGYAEAITFSEIRHAYRRKYDDKIKFMNKYS